MQFPARDLTNQFISLSYQDVTQRYTAGTSSYLLDGLGYVIFSIPTSETGSQLITPLGTASYAISSSYAGYTTLAGVALVSENSLTASLTDTASYVAAANVIGTVESASYALSASWAPGGSTGNSDSASWASQSLNSTYSTQSLFSTQSVYSTQSIYATSASWVSASAFITTAQTASYVAADNVVGTLSATQTPIALSASWVSASNIITTADTASFITASNVIGTVQSASYAFSASWAPSGGGVISGGSYDISASWASSSLSSSYALSASWAPGGSTGNSDSASWASSSISASYAPVPTEWNLPSGVSMDSFQDYPLGTFTSWNKGVGWNGNGYITGSNANSCSIVERTGSGGQIERSLLMPSGSQIIRKLGFGSSWEKLSIVVLLNINESASFTSSMSENTMFLGVCFNTGSFITGNPDWCGVHMSTDANFRIATVITTTIFKYSLKYFTWGSTLTVGRHSGSGAPLDDPSASGTMGNLFHGVLAPGVNNTIWRGGIALTITRPASLVGAHTVIGTGANSPTILRNYDFATARNNMLALPIGNSVSGLNTNTLGSTTTSTTINYNETASLYSGPNGFDSFQISWGGRATSSLENRPTSALISGIIVMKQY